MRFENLRDVRLRAGFSLAEVAQAAGHSIGWVWQVERGLLRPARGDAEEIAALLDTQPEELFGRIREEAA